MPRDFGDSAGYGHGGSERDAHEVEGRGLDRPNPLDKVVQTKPAGEKKQPAGPHAAEHLTDGGRTPGSGALPGEVKGDDGADPASG
jgi:hypothetical protein